MIWKKVVKEIIKEKIETNYQFKESIKGKGHERSPHDLISFIRWLTTGDESESPSKPSESKSLIKLIADLGEDIHDYEGEFQEGLKLWSTDQEVEEWEKELYGLFSKRNAVNQADPSMVMEDGLRRITELDVDVIGQKCLDTVNLHILETSELLLKPM
jgi:hypothetical protein